MKDKIIYWLKLVLLIVPPLLGYFFLYAMIWFANVGAIDARACLFCLGLAGLSEFGFLKWVGRWEDDD